MSPDLTFDPGLSVPEILSSGRATVSLLGEKIRISVRAKPADRTAIGKALGIVLPAQIGKAASKKGLLAACLGPDEWIVISDMDRHADMPAKALEVSGEFVMSVTDISHRNIALQISGDGAADMINTGCPLDLSTAAFPVGKCTRTVFENAPVLLYRKAADVFIIECWRSYGPYVVELMAAHARG